MREKDEYFFKIFFSQIIISAAAAAAAAIAVAALRSGLIMPRHVNIAGTYRGV